MPLVSLLHQCGGFVEVRLIQRPIEVALEPLHHVLPSVGMHCSKLYLAGGLFGHQDDNLTSLQLHSLAQSHSDLFAISLGYRGRVTLYLGYHAQLVVIAIQPFRRHYHDLLGDAVAGRIGEQYRHSVGVLHQSLALARELPPTSATSGQW